MAAWSTEDTITLIEKLDEEHVIASTDDVVFILKKLNDPNDPDQEFFREKISA